MPEGIWGKEIKKATITMGITMSELAETIGLSREYLSSIVSGRIRCPDSTKQKISDAVNVDVSLPN